MGISLDLEIRKRLGLYLNGSLSLQEFKDWFLPAAWDIVPGENHGLDDLIRELQLRLAEASSGHWTEKELRDLFRPLATFFAMYPADSPRTIIQSSGSQIMRSWMAPQGMYVDIGYARVSY
jgi:hypothetical protein